MESTANIEAVPNRNECLTGSTRYCRTKQLWSRLEASSAFSDTRDRVTHGAGRRAAFRRMSSLDCLLVVLSLPPSLSRLSISP